MNTNISEYISNGRAVMGIELGSTRIKAVLIGEDFSPIASGSHEWENKLENGIWTYSLNDVWLGIQDAYSKLKADVSAKYGTKLTKLAAIGFSAMMHGYLVFDKDDHQLAQFRTWRNTTTEEAAQKLTAEFGFNIPQRWSIAHLYQAMLGNEPHVKDIAFITTLAGYVHWALTGERVLGIGDASGMFPIDSEKNNYSSAMVAKFDDLLAAHGCKYTLSDILPQVLGAGEEAGRLTPKGAALLDPTGELEAGIPLCPPEGDAGTGMTATNSVAARTGNVSAGTSVFAMAVLENSLSKVYPEIDMVTTPTGKAVAMVHCNNCTSDINAWAEMFHGMAKAIGSDVSVYKILDAIFFSSLEAEKDCAGIITVNYFSGEPITHFDQGRPLLVRTPDSNFSFANLSRSLIFSAIASLKIGMDILEQENVKLDKLFGHGGFFKAKGVGQKLLAGALKVPVSVMETAGEGGPWGMALLASYLVNKSCDETLEDYLENKVFAASNGETIAPEQADIDGFEMFLKGYISSLEVEKAAIEVIGN